MESEESMESTRNQWNQPNQPGINGINKESMESREKLRMESGRNQWNQQGISGIKRESSGINRINEIKWNQRNQAKNALIPGINGISYAFYGVIRPSIVTHNMNQSGNKKKVSIKGYHSLHAAYQSTVTYFKLPL